jgi:hypothetical protein
LEDSDKEIITALIESLAEKCKNNTLKIAGNITE